MSETPTQSGTLPPRPAPNRREELDLHDRLGLRHPPAPARRSLRHRVLEGFKTLLWVVPLTALIWIYAEREQIVDPVVISGVPIRIISSVPDRLVESLPSSPVVDLEVKGPRAGIDVVRQKLSKPGTVLDVVLPDDFQPSFDGEVPIADWIGRNELFTREAVTVKSARPLSIRVSIELRASLTVPLKVHPEDRAKIGGEITLPVSTVTVEGPQSKIQDVPDDRKVAYVDMSRFLASYAGGTHAEDVPVTFPAAPELSITPKTVKVTATMGAPAKQVLQTIPVWVEISALTLGGDEYKVSVPYTMENVQITGPQKAIDTLLKDWNDGKPPIAVVVITEDDLKRPEVQSGAAFAKPLSPDNIVLRDPALTVTACPPEIKVTIIKR